MQEKHAATKSGATAGLERAIAFLWTGSKGLWHAPWRVVFAAWRHLRSAQGPGRFCRQPPGIQDFLKAATGKWRVCGRQMLTMIQII